MQKREHLHKRILKNIESFRSRQRKTVGSTPEVKTEQYRELQAILSPFWAWRNKTI